MNHQQWADVIWRRPIEAEALHWLSDNKFEFWLTVFDLEFKVLTSRNGQRMHKLILAAYVSAG